MNLPYFYMDDYRPDKKDIVLNEDTSRHIIQVLRMKKGGQLHLTDGRGNLVAAEITDDHKKHCAAKIIAASYKPQASRKITVAISLLKNSSRFEWFLEKATEIGVNEIIPVICERTEKQKFRVDRLKNILVSAMLQSQKSWLPVLHQPVPFEKVFQIEDVKTASQKFIAHCIEEEKRVLPDLVNETLPSQVILIGPEGDFTKEEVQLAIANHFDAVSLGEARLRAETAGMVAATLLRIT